MAAKCSTIVLQKAPIGALCNTILLPYTATFLYISIIHLYAVSVWFSKVLLYLIMTCIAYLQMQGTEISLENDQRELAYYSIEPGDIIQVKLDGE